MKMPKQVKRYCPTCKSHQLAKVIAERTRARPATKKGAFSWGARHQFEIESGYGSFPKPIVHEKAKTTKKANLRFQCTKCGKSNYKQTPKRLRKVELT